MKHVYTLILTLPLLMLSACFAGTAYQPMGTDSTGGYMHEKHSRNHYTVGFAGNGFTKADQAYDFTVLRAAELGQELGYKYFIIEGTHNKTSVSKSQGITTFNASPTYGGGISGIAQPSTVRVSKPGYKIDVRYYDNKPSKRDGKSIGVADTIDTLRAKHGIGNNA